MPLGPGRLDASGPSGRRGLLDSHCHLDDARYTTLEGVERRRLAAGVRVLVPSTTLEGHAHLRQQAAEHGWMYGVGLHPDVALTPDVWSASGSAGLLAERLEARLAAVPMGAVAIGECGLHRPERRPMASQIGLLLVHLDAARRHGLPVILHCVRAHDVLPAVLNEFSSGKPGRIAGVMHSYSGGAALVHTYERLGLHLSFGGAITWAGARKPVEALRAVRADRLLLESDGPDQRPDLSDRAGRGPSGSEAPHLPASRGIEFGPLSEPAMLPIIAQNAARLRGAFVQELLEQLDTNARALGW